MTTRCWRSFGADPHAQTALDGLAERAAEIGRLADIARRVIAQCSELQTNSSLTSNTIAPQHVPAYYGQLSNWDATYYTHLKAELLRAVGWTHPFDVHATIDRGAVLAGSRKPRGCTKLLVEMPPVGFSGRVGNRRALDALGAPTALLATIAE